MSSKCLSLHTVLAAGCAKCLIYQGCTMSPKGDGVATGDTSSTWNPFHSSHVTPDTGVRKVVLHCVLSGFFDITSSLRRLLYCGGTRRFKDVVCDGVNGTTASLCSLLVNDNSELVHQCSGEGSYGNLLKQENRCLNPRQEP